MTSLNISVSHVNYRLTIIQISATGGTDYQVEAQQVRFSPGESLRTLNISVLDDVVIEGKETFLVRIDSDDSQVRILEPQNITVTIIDNDGTFLNKNRLKNLLKVTLIHQN